jgi:hypothetical protein
VIYLKNNKGIAARERNSLEREIGYRVFPLGGLAMAGIKLILCFIIETAL